MESPAPPPAVSVVVTTYNWPEALAVALRALLRQHCAPAYEIIVADDGSEPSTAAAVAALAHGARVPIRHVRQAHDGFRPAAVRNLGIAAARGAYIVCIDQDCMAPADFLARHRALAEAGHFVTGRRSWMGRWLTRQVLAGRLAAGGAWGKWIGWGALGQITGPFELVPLPARAAWRDRQAGEWRRAQTCNLAFWRADWARIGGFDERYRGHGLEDSDFVVRLLRAGVRRRDGRYGSIVLHLNHPRPQRGESPNTALFAEMMAGSRVQAGHPASPPGEASALPIA